MTHENIEIPALKEEKPQCSNLDIETLLEDKRLVPSSLTEEIGVLNATKQITLARINYLKSQNESLANLSGQSLAEIGSSSGQKTTISQNNEREIKSLTNDARQLETQISSLTPKLEQSILLTESEKIAIKQAVDNPPEIIKNLFSKTDKIFLKAALEELTQALLKRTIFLGNGWEILDNLNGISNTQTAPLIFMLNHLRRFNKINYLCLKIGMNEILARTQDNLYSLQDEALPTPLDEFGEMDFSEDSDCYEYELEILASCLWPKIVDEKTQKALIKVWKNADSKLRSFIVNDSSGFQMGLAITRDGELVLNDPQKIGKDFVETLFDSGLAHKYVT